MMAFVGPLARWLGKRQELTLTSSIDNTTHVNRDRCLFTLRIDLFGNWSDHLSFISHRPSRVINTAFCLTPDRFPIHIKLTRLKQPIVRYLSIDLRVTRSLSFEEIVETPVLNALLEYYSGSTPDEFYEGLLKKGGSKCSQILVSHFTVVLARVRR